MTDFELMGLALEEAAKAAAENIAEDVAQIDAAGAAEAAKATAEDIAKNVAQIHTIAAKTAKAAGAAAVLCCISGVNTGKAVLVVQLALFRVRKHLVCLVDLLELCLGVLIAGVIVRVVLHGKLAVCLFDLGIACALGYPQHFVIITLFLCHIHSPLQPLPSRSVSAETLSGADAPAPPRGELRPRRETCPHRQKLAHRESWHCEAMTERVYIL